jgi:hypothetical protein
VVEVEIDVEVDVVVEGALVPVVEVGAGAARGLTE